MSDHSECLLHSISFMNDSGLHAIKMLCWSFLLIKTLNLFAFRPFLFYGQDYRVGPLKTITVSRIYLCLSYNNVLWVTLRNYHMTEEMANELLIGQASFAIAWAFMINCKKTNQKKIFRRYTVYFLVQKICIEASVIRLRSQNVPFVMPEGWSLIFQIFV